MKSPCQYCPIGPPNSYSMSLIHTAADNVRVKEYPLVDGGYYIARPCLVILYMAKEAPPPQRSFGSAINGQMRRERRVEFRPWLAARRDKTIASHSNNFFFKNLFRFDTTCIMYNSLHFSASHSHQKRGIQHPTTSGLHPPPSISANIPCHPVGGKRRPAESS